MIAEELAAWVSGSVTVPDRVRASARRHLVDGFGVALAAVRLDAASPAVTVARGLAGPPDATIIGSDARVSAPAAALANGTLVHALDFDDTHAGGLVHATAIVLPAAFAVGQQRGSGGAEVLDAVVVGLEVACRVPSAAPHRFHARGLHATMIAGVFSSAAVAARLMGLSAEQTTAALGIAGSQAGGLLAFLATGASTKQLHPGLASQSGILAARLAAAGASGPETVFDGPHGVFDALAGGEADPASIVADLGTRWEAARIGIKPYPVCQLSHATLDAVAAVRREHRFGPDDVVRIEADVHPDSAPTVCDESRDLTKPASAYAAKFSLPWCVAALLVDGTLGLDAFEPDRLGRPEVAELASRVTWRLTDGAGHAADAPGHVRITLADGTVVEGAVERSGGGPDQPLTNDQVRAKAVDNGGTAAGVVADLVDRLEELDSVDPVLDATRTTR
jgi:2-methylcitrate dehydratase PrpD